METKAFVSDATDADFQEKVLKRSLDVPVLLDCWATWCGPCKTLGPILESLAAEYEGRFELVKVDVDQSQQVAMALQVQTVPTVFMIKDGRPVDGFQGAQSETAIRALLDRHVEPPAFDPHKAADAAYAEGDLDTAAQLYRQILTEQSGNGAALLGMARIGLTAGDASAALGWLEQVDASDGAYDSAQKLKGLVALSEDAGVLNTLENAVAQDASDVDAWYSLGATYALAGRYEEAISAFLSVIQLDLEYREQAARKALVSVFEAVGMTDPLVVRSRRLLANFLF